MIFMSCAGSVCGVAYCELGASSAVGAPPGAAPAVGLLMSIASALAPCDRPSCALALAATLAQPNGGPPGACRGEIMPEVITLGSFCACVIGALPGVLLLAWLLDASSCGVASATATRDCGTRPARLVIVEEECCVAEC
jgi:hypothetical protein